MSDSLITLLRPFEHASRWERYNSIGNTITNAMLLRGELQAAGDIGRAAEVQLILSQAKAELRQWAAEWDAVRQAIESDAPKLLPHFPPVGITVDPAERSSAVAVALGELLTKPAATSVDAPWPEYMSTDDIASRLNLPREATRKKCERLRDKYDCAIENESPRYGEPKWLYRTEIVIPELQK